MSVQSSFVYLNSHFCRGALQVHLYTNYLEGAINSKQLQLISRTEYQYNALQSCKLDYFSFWSNPIQILEYLLGRSKLHTHTSTQQKQPKRKVIGLQNLNILSGNCAGHPYEPKETAIHTYRTWICFLVSQRHFKVWSLVKYFLFRVIWKCIWIRSQNSWLHAPVIIIPISQWHSLVVEYNKDSTIYEY